MGAAVVVVGEGDGDGLEVVGVVQAYVTTLNITNKTTVIVGNRTGVKEMSFSKSYKKLTQHDQSGSNVRHGQNCGRKNATDENE